MKVILFAFMLVRLALKGDSKVGAHQVARLEQTQEPLYAVPYIKRKDEHFQHLTRVDMFVVQVRGRKRLTPSHEDKAEEVDRREAAEGDEPIDNHIYESSSLRFLPRVMSAGFIWQKRRNCSRLSYVTA